ncbi:hypothetical protein T492DRAFT_842147 [Pavlovales sp. CCMP2436]|nr:hypothetical protein T492DRAFT_842147 [Pavlovales sp. CCMP2436]
MLVCASIFDFSKMALRNSARGSEHSSTTAARRRFGSDAEEFCTVISSKAWIISRVPPFKSVSMMAGLRLSSNAEIKSAADGVAVRGAIQCAEGAKAGSSTVARREQSNLKAALVERGDAAELRTQLRTQE